VPFKPKYPGEIPTLGWGVLEFIEEYLAQPDCSEYKPMILTREQAQFVLNFYQIDLVTNKRKMRRAVWSRPKGAGKSPLMSALAATEALGDVVFDGWDSLGRPVGKPWAKVRTPWVQLAAVSEDQTKNSYTPLLEMLREGPAIDNFAIDPMETFVALPKGRIEFVTSAAASREGNRPVFVALDQTEEWRPSNGGIRLAATLRRNLGKTGGASIESPNAFIPGEGSVAEASANYWAAIKEGRAADEGLLYDHREAPPNTDMYNRESLMDGLVYVYGDSAIDAGGWVDLDRVVAEVWDPDTAPQDARRFYLNQVTHASNSWLSQPEWAACGPTRDPITREYPFPRVITKDEPICLGFDGSRSRTRGKTDATALIGCTVKDGYIFQIAVWEHPDKVDSWQVPTVEVEAKIREQFEKFNVVGFYADPAKWESYVSDWEARYNKRLKVKSTQNHPIEWWMTGGRSGIVAKALESFHTAVVEGELSHDGSSILTRHILNARRKVRNQTLQIGKEHPESENKIDAAVAAVLAWQARLDAVAKGLSKTLSAPQRIR
jgi:hypothetical protein